MSRNGTTVLYDGFVYFYWHAVNRGRRNAFYLEWHCGILWHVEIKFVENIIFCLLFRVYWWSWLLFIPWSRDIYDREISNCIYFIGLMDTWQGFDIWQASDIWDAFVLILLVWYIMMTSSNGNIFRITGPLCGEFTGHRWISLTKASNAVLWYFLWFAPE